MVGDIELLGRLPPSTRFAISPSFFFGTNAKSVISLLSKNPPAINRLPKPVSIVEVNESELP